MGEWNVNLLEGWGERRQPNSEWKKEAEGHHVKGGGQKKKKEKR